MAWNKVVLQDGDHIVNEQGRQDHVSNTMSSPYYRFDWVDDYISMSHSTNHNMGINDFSISAWIYPETLTDEVEYAIAGKWKSSVGYYLAVGQQGSRGGDLNLRTRSSSGDARIYTTSENTIVVNKWQHVVVSCDRDGTTSFYINGVSHATTGSVRTDNIDPSGGFEIGTITSGTYDFSGSIAGVQLYNIALSATEVKELYSGASVPFKYKGASQTNQLTNASFAADTDWTKGIGWTITGGKAVKAAGTAGFIYQDGVLTAGKMYRLSMTISGYSAGYIRFQPGAASGYFNADGTHTFDVVVTTGMFRLYADANFVASIDSVSAVQIGTVAEYDGSGATGTTWYDKSGNNLDGTVTGATLENKVESIEFTGNISGSSTSTGSFGTVEAAHFTGDGAGLSNVPDYVFEPEYVLKSLSDVEAYVSQSKHLPGIPGMDELDEWKKYSVGDRDMLLLEKIEELTLYVIRLEKRVKDLENN